MKYVTIDKISDGDMLASTIFDNNCNILLTANSQLTNRYIDRIKKLGFKGLYIYDIENENINIDLLSDETRQKALKNLKHINIDDCLFIANAITNKILENPNTMYELMTICSYDTLTYQHCINVAILSTMIGIDMKLPNARLFELSQAALLHDIGKTAVDEKILNKKGKLTDKEFSIMKQHTIFGYNMLRNNENISENVRKGILYHHENEDGSGYPMKLKKDNIPIIAKIIHVADVYDAMISKRSYKDKINPADVLEYMMGNARIFDIEVIQALIHCVTLYPIGSEVTLSNGKNAIIVRNQKDFPQRPTIRIGTMVIDLTATLNITITALLT